MTSLLAAILLAALLYVGGVWIFFGEAIAAGQIDTIVLLFVYIALSCVILVVPTIAAKRIVARTRRNSQYRFGPLLKGDRHYERVAPSILVLDVHEAVRGPLKDLPARDRNMINDWLVKTWDDDRRVWLSYSGFRTAQDFAVYWQAVKSRIDSFKALRTADAEDVRSALDKLARKEYRFAYSKIERHVDRTASNEKEAKRIHEATLAVYSTLLAHAPDELPSSLEAVESPHGDTGAVEEVLN